MADPFEGLVVGIADLYQQEQRQQVSRGNVAPSSTLGIYNPNAGPQTGWPMNVHAQQQLSNPANVVGHLPGAHGRVTFDTARKEVAPQLVSMMPSAVPLANPKGQPVTNFAQPSPTPGTHGVPFGHMLSQPYSGTMPIRVKTEQPVPTQTREVDGLLSIAQPPGLKPSQWHPASAASSPQSQNPGQRPADTAIGGNQGGKGAEWTPPGEQLPLYQSMFAVASAESAVPGTVSGRAAVQFFSRSGLPKDTLKTVRWQPQRGRKGTP